MFVYILLGILIVYVGLVLIFRPSHNRDWTFEQEVLPQIVYGENGLIKIDGFRNFDWQVDGETLPSYETREFNLNDLMSVDVLVSHFSDFEGFAHTFLSFGLKDGGQIVISLEARRQVGEKYSPVLGMLRQYEIIYVVGSETDIVGVRADVKGERVYLYPTKATPEQAKELFTVLAADINSIYEKPRFYNTIYNNCTNEITRRVEEMSDIKFPLSWKTLLPGYVDEVLYELKIIDTSLSFEEIKVAHKIDNQLVDRKKTTYSVDLRSNTK